MNVYSAAPQTRRMQTPGDYPMLPQYCDAKAAADYCNRYGGRRQIPVEWLPTNLERSGRKNPVDCLLFGRYQETRTSDKELRWLMKYYPPIDSMPNYKPRRSATAEYFAAANPNIAPVPQPPAQPAYRPASTPQPYPVQQLPRPFPQLQQHAYAVPVPFDGRPQPMMQSVQQRPQRPAYNSRLSTTSLTSEGDYDSYDDSPPKPSHHKHHKNKRPPSLAAKLDQKYERVLEEIGGASMTVERFLKGAPRNKSGSGHHQRRDSYSDAGSYSDADSYSMSSYEENDRRRRRRSMAPQYSRKSSMINARDARYDNERYGLQGGYRRSVCV